MIPTKVFIHYLERMGALLKKVELFEQDISCNRLYVDMFPLLQQAKTAINFSLRCSCPLADREIVSFAKDDLSFSNVFLELEETLKYLSSIPNEDFQHMDVINISTAAGFADLKFSGSDYFIMYSLPNFMFHYCMFYAIARQAGVKIGKSDFDSYHKYPLGFTFTDECE